MLLILHGTQSGHQFVLDESQILKFEGVVSIPNDVGWCPPR